MKKRSLNIFYFNLVLVGLLTSCAELFHNRTFIDEMDRDTDGLIVAGRDFQTVPGDTGRAYRSHQEILKRTPMSERYKRKLTEEESLKYELAKKEDRLSPAEYRDYVEFKELMPSLSEKIYYLSLTPQERLRFISEKRQLLGGVSSSMGWEYMKEQSVNDGHLYLGMDKESVINSWGRPEKIDIAGDAEYENERWSFYEDGKIKKVYFERGQVQGWTLE